MGGQGGDIAVTPSPQNRADPSPSTRLKQSTYPKRRTAAVNLAMAGVMHQPQIREVVFAPTFLGNPMMDMEILTIFQVLMAHRADALLFVDELSATQHRHLGFRSSLSPSTLISFSRVVSEVSGYLR